MGPLNMARQRDYVQELLAESRAGGTEVIDGGEFVDADPSEGNFMKPALVLDPSAAERIVTEEQFGPALPIIPYDTEEEAVRLANDTWAGLCASVWSGDDEHAMRIGRQLRAGHVFFNNHNATAVDERAMFGGFNQSGIGRELGREASTGSPRRRSWPYRTVSRPTELCSAVLVGRRPAGRRPGCRVRRAAPTGSCPVKRAR